MRGVSVTHFPFLNEMIAAIANRRIRWCGNLLKMGQRVIRRLV
jgi:glutamate racemase